MTPFQKYLQGYAEAETQLSQELNGQWTSAVAIPSYGEGLAPIATLESLSIAARQVQSKVLSVIVLNAKEDSPTDLLESNRALVDELVQRGFQRHPSFTQGRYSDYLDVFVVDRSALPFPNNQGVGLARKIGCDLICKLIEENKIQTPWIWTTDADALVAEDYFSVGPLDVQVAAYLYPYTHDPTFEEAIAKYEAYLKYYENGLKTAGSPYAFQTVGSTFLINAHSYSAVRGFPKRLAGEDFYLLNKLAKVGKIKTLCNQPLILSSRVSERVPFGTGAAISKITQLIRENKPYLIYNPSCFSSLKNVLQVVTHALTGDTPEEALAVIETSLDPIEISALHTLGVIRHLDTIFETRRSQTQRLSHFHSFFDALKTLRFIHLMEEKFPKQHSQLLRDTQPNTHFG